MMFQLHRIKVSSVIQTNDCAGRVTLYVSQNKADEVAAPRWKITAQPMDPMEKLRLASVKVGDTVTVRMEPSTDDLLCEGVYIDTDTLTWVQATCQCTTVLLSDGFGVYCTNPYCGVTMAARLQRLSQTQFFQSRYRYGVNAKGESVSPYYITGDSSVFVKEYPFSSLGDSQTWGSSDYPLSRILSSTRVGVISMATFLVRDLFQEFVENIIPSLELRQEDYFAINDYYGALIEATQCRIGDNPYQDGLIFNTIWALGIQSLSADVIWKMMIYEKTNNYGHDTLIPYAYLLSRPQVLAYEAGIDIMEAQSIYREFMVRRYEMFDIFGSYSSKEGVADVFHR